MILPYLCHSFVTSFLSTLLSFFFPSSLASSLNALLAYFVRSFLVTRIEGGIYISILHLQTYKVILQRPSLSH